MPGGIFALRKMNVDEFKDRYGKYITANEILALTKAHQNSTLKIKKKTIRAIKEVYSSKNTFVPFGLRTIKVLDELFKITHSQNIAWFEKFEYISPIKKEIEFYKKFEGTFKTFFIDSNNHTSNDFIINKSYTLKIDPDIISLDNGTTNYSCKIQKTNTVFKRKDSIKFTLYSNDDIVHLLGSTKFLTYSSESPESEFNESKVNCFELLYLAFSQYDLNHPIGGRMLLVRDSFYKELSMTNVDFVSNFFSNIPIEGYLLKANNSILKNIIEDVDQKSISFYRGGWYLYAYIEYKEIGTDRPEKKIIKTKISVINANTVKYAAPSNKYKVYLEGNKIELKYNRLYLTLHSSSEITFIIAEKELENGVPVGSYTAFQHLDIYRKYVINNHGVLIKHSDNPHDFDTIKTSPGWEQNADCDFSDLLKHLEISENELLAFKTFYDRCNLD